MEKLGIEPVQLLTQALNFTIMMVILTKFLYGPVTRALEARKKKIEQSLADSEKIKLELEKTEKKKADVLAQARSEARQIVEAGKKEGKRVSEEIVEKAHAEARDILEKGKRDVQSERAEMEMKLRDETITLAQQFAAKVLEDALSAKEQRAILSKKIHLITKQKFE